MIVANKNVQEIQNDVSKKKQGVAPAQLATLHHVPARARCAQRTTKVGADSREENRPSNTMDDLGGELTWSGYAGSIAASAETNATERVAVGFLCILCPVLCGNAVEVKTSVVTEASLNGVEEVRDRL